MFSDVWKADEHHHRKSGGITELSGRWGTGKTSWILSQCARDPSSRIAWIDESRLFYPPVLSAFGLSPAHWVGVHAPKRSVEAAHEVLKSGFFRWVVLAPAVSQGVTVQDLRKLQIFSERSQSFLFLMRQAPLVQGSWAVQNQLFFGAAARSIEVLKWKTHSPLLTMPKSYPKTSSLGLTLV